MNALYDETKKYYLEWLDMTEGDTGDILLKESIKREEVQRNTKQSTYLGK